MNSQINIFDEIIVDNFAGGAAWRVKCYDCGATVDKGNRVRHDAQNNWNGSAR